MIDMSNYNTYIQPRELARFIQTSFEIRKLSIKGNLVHIFSWLLKCYLTGGKWHVKEEKSQKSIIDIIRLVIIIGRGSISWLPPTKLSKNCLRKMGITQSLEMITYCFSKICCRGTSAKINSTIFSFGDGIKYSIKIWSALSFKFKCRSIITELSRRAVGFARFWNNGLQDGSIIKLNR